MEIKLSEKLKTRAFVFFGTILVALFAFELSAEAKCSIRVGDPLITARYQACKTREFLSYLYNDLVTPFSFTCAKKLSATCRQENCDEPKSEDERKRCLGRYVEVLNECSQQIDDAARMARCKDTKAWPVGPMTARAAPPPAAVAPAATTMRAAPITVPAGPAVPALVPGAPVIAPDSLESPPRIEVLPVYPDVIQTSAKGFHSSQSGRNGN